MKYEKFMYAIGTSLVVCGAMFKVLHMPYANVLLMLGFTGMMFYQSWLITQLKQRVRELEVKEKIN
jgi:hypothetical protein